MQFFNKHSFENKSKCLPWLCGFENKFARFYHWRTVLTLYRLYFEMRFLKMVILFVVISTARRTWTITTAIYSKRYRVHAVWPAATRLKRAWRWLYRQRSILWWYICLGRCLSGHLALQLRRMHGRCWFQNVKTSYENRTIKEKRDWTIPTDVFSISPTPKKIH